MTNRKRTQVGQINIHVSPENAYLVSFLNSVKESNVPASTMAEAAIEIAWQHFPNEVKALTHKKCESRPSSSTWIKEMQEENARLKQQLGLSA